MEKGEFYALQKLPLACDKEKLLFRVLSPKDDEDQSVEVEEAEQIDFRIVKKRLVQGESVFITPKRKQKLNNLLVDWEDVAKPWYFLNLSACAQVNARRRMDGWRNFSGGVNGEED